MIELFLFKKIINLILQTLTVTKWFPAFIWHSCRLTVTRQVSLVEQELLTLSVLVGLCCSISSFRYSFLSFCPFSFGLYSSFFNLRAMITAFESSNISIIGCACVCLILLTKTRKLQQSCERSRLKK